MKLKPAGYGSPNNPSESRRMFADTPVRRPAAPVFTAPYESTDDSAGCCGPCVDRRFMTIFGNFAQQYRVTKIPASLGGPVILDYIGLTPSGGSAFPGVTPDDPYWESDTIDVTCDAGTETYLWRMVVGASSPCRAGGGSDNVWLYLVKDGTATLCAFDEWKCASLTEDPVRQYLNIEDFRARCGSKLYLHWPQGLNEELEDILPCTVCVEPVGEVGYIAAGSADSSACWDAFMAFYGLTQIPSLLSAVVTVDGTDYNLLMEYNTSLKVFRIQTNPTYTGSPSAPGYTLGDAQVFLEVGCPTGGGGGWASTGWYLTVSILCAVATSYANTYATASGVFNVTKLKATPACASVANVDVVISEL